MADVSVEFGATDSGLAQTLKNVQTELAALNTQQTTAAMSADEFQKSLNKIRQLEGLETKLQAMTDSTRNVGTEAAISTPKVDQLGSTIKGAGDKSTESAGMFDASFTKIAAAFTVGNLAAKAFETVVNAVFTGARAVADSFGDALDLGGRLSELSARTGEAAGKLLVLETAFKNSGLEASAVGTVINKLQNFMTDAATEGTKQAAAMDALGIKMSELSGKTPTQQMGVFAKAISGIEDPTARASTASDVFGDKLGGKLLPLLTQFSPALDDAETKVGSLAEVMDENADTFDEAGETIEAVQGKLAAFAAGILSEVIPEIQKLGTAMENVDAAGFGKKIGNIIAPSLKCVVQDITLFNQGITALGAGLKSITIGLGGTATGFENFRQDTLKTISAVAALLPNGFNPLTVAIKGAGAAADAMVTSNEKATTSIDGIGTAAGATAPKLDATATAADGVATSLNAIGGDSGGAFASINEGATTFKSLIDEGKVSLSDMTGEIGAQIPLTTEHAEIMGEINVSLGEANEKASEQLDKIEQQVTAEQARNNMIAARQATSLADYNTQNQINAALAVGNTTLAEGLIAKERHKDLTEKIMKDTGLSKDEAQKLATETINVADAAEKAKGHVGGLKGNLTNAATEAGTVQEAVKKINQEKMDNSAEALNAALVESRTKLGDMKDFIGIDMSKMSIEDIIKKLGLDVDIMATQEEKVKAINAAVTALAALPVTEITPTVDEIGVNEKLEAVKTALANINAPNVTPTVGSVSSGVTGVNNELKGVKTPDATPSINESDLQAAVDNANEALKGISAETIIIDLDASKSIASIRSELASPITMDLQGGTDTGAGSGLLGDIKSLVDAIKGAVEKIESKLPMQALA
jgi:hypothetical protein